MTKKSRKTPDERNAEANKLATIKPTVKRHSMFGDDHHAAIDAQIGVLRDNTNEDDIYTEYQDGADSILDAALDARRWIDGEADTAPSKEWEELKK